jgi:hypothetical protein
VYAHSRHSPDCPAYIRPHSSKCLHYYCYFQDAKFGLVHLRVPTWAPFRLRFHCNGHSWLARKLTAKGTGYTMADNAFVRIDDRTRAQQLADDLSPDQLHRTLDRYAALCCPVSDVFGQSYHWSLMQAQYATDLAFRSTATLGVLCTTNRRNHRKPRRMCDKGPPHRASPRLSKVTTDAHR